MRLPSSPILVYFITYSISYVLSIIIHLTHVPLISSPLFRVYIIDFYITCVLFFIGNYIYSSNNIYDIHWPLIPLTCSLYFHFTSNSLEFCVHKHLPLILIIFLWSSHLICQTIFLSKNIQHEDWRYQLMRRKYEKNFIIFAFFGLHILPMFSVLIGSSSIYYIYNNDRIDERLTMMDIMLFSIIVLGVLLENIADSQLSTFRHHKQNSRELRFSVLSTGLWKYSRHPNYLGELMFWWGLFFLGYYYDAPLWCALGPLFITLMMVGGSIPMTEERLFRKYPDYKFTQQRIPMLIPTFGY